MCKIIYPRNFLSIRYKSIKFLNHTNISLQNFSLNKAMREIYARETFVSLEYECIKFLRAKFRHKVQ